MPNSKTGRNFKDEDDDESESRTASADDDDDDVEAVKTTTTTVPSYRDFAHVEEEDFQQSSESGGRMGVTQVGAFSSANTTNGVKNEQNFPVKLHFMLSDMESDGLDYIISWQPHGRAFMVHKQEAFVARVLPL